jgi:hypothetical protein
MSNSLGTGYIGVDVNIINDATQDALNLKADKTYVDTELALKADKTYVDTELALKADKTYVDTELALKADTTYVDAETTARISADTALQDDINTRALTTALTAETTARINADTTLQDDINTRALTSALTAETNARISADNALQGDINTNADAINTNANNIGQEIANRQIADTTLQNDINTRALTSALTAETNARISADNALQGDINANATAITTNAFNIGQEIANRQSADTTLQNDINTRALASALTAETNARISADTALQGDINTNANNINTNANNIGQEIANRQIADTTLQDDINTRALATALTAETNARISADVLLAPINDADLTGNTQMTRLTINHSDTASIGIACNNTNTNQYAGAFSTSAYGWRFFNNNTALVNNNTFGVFTKGTGSQLNPLLIKNDGKLYTLDQEVDGDVNMSAGHLYKIDGVDIFTPYRTSADTDTLLDLKAPINDADLTGNTKLDRLTIDHSDTASVGIVCNNTNNNQYAGAFNTSAYGWRFFNNNTSVQGNTTFGVYTKGTGSQLNPLLIKNDGKLYTLDQEVDGDVNMSAGHLYKIDGVELKNVSETLTNKTIDGNNNTLTNVGSAIGDNSLSISQVNLLQANLDSKASTLYVLTQLENYASISYVVTQLNYKADRTYVDTRDNVIIAQINNLKDQTETLTNKTIDATANTLQNVSSAIADNDLSIAKTSGLAYALETKVDLDSQQTITGTKSFATIGADRVGTPLVTATEFDDMVINSVNTAYNTAVKITNNDIAGFTQTPTKTTIARALNIQYSSVPLGTSTNNKSPPAGAVSGDIYRDDANALHITPP